MSIRSVTCPGCNTSLNVPAAMANVKCPQCATIWNVGNPAAAQWGASAKAAQKAAVDAAEQNEKQTSQLAIIAAMVGGAMVLLVIVGISAILLSSTPAPSTTAVDETVETIKPATPQPYRVVKLPEEQRRRIYDDYRKVARSTVETPLMLPDGTRVRASVENMLQKTYERELVHFAALNDIDVDDVHEIIKEGDANVWDDSPRSNATRDGKRVYAEEMSVGGSNPAGQ